MALALSSKDASALATLTARMPVEAQQGLMALLRLYGGSETLDAARRELPARPLVRDALDQLQWLATHLKAAYPALRIGFDPVGHEWLRLRQRPPTFCHLRPVIPH